MPCHTERPISEIRPVGGIIHLNEAEKNYLGHDAVAWSIQMLDIRAMENACTSFSF
jgi:hypothetical protein